MSTPMDDRRILAEIERCLAEDDPDLDSLMGTLNEQFGGDEGDDAGHGRPKWDRRWVTAAVLAVVALLAMILTLIFTARPTAEGDGGEWEGHMSSASVQSEHQAVDR